MARSSTRQRVSFGADAYRGSCPDPPFHSSRDEREHETCHGESSHGEIGLFPKMACQPATREGRQRKTQCRGGREPALHPCSVRFPRNAAEQEHASEVSCAET
jgi:hypothetical protein